MVPYGTRNGSSGWVRCSWLDLMNRDCLVHSDLGVGMAGLLPAEVDHYMQHEVMRWGGGCSMR